MKKQIELIIEKIRTVKSDVEDFGNVLSESEIIENVVLLEDAIIELNHMAGKTGLTREQIEFWREKEKEDKSEPYCHYFSKLNDIDALHLGALDTSISGLTRKIQDAWKEGWQ